MFIEGLNAVSESLAGGITIEKIYMQKGLFSERLREILASAREQKIRVEFLEKPALDKLSEGKRHQGVIAVATAFSYADFDALLAAAPKPEGRLFLLLDGVEDPHNLGAVLRVADAAGADAVLIPRHRSAGVTDTVIRISAGAAAHVRVARVANLNDAIRRLKEASFFVFAADMDGASVYETDLTGDIALIIGGEGAGVHALTKKLADGVVSLPQRGMVNSLNASVAAGVLLYEAVRQRTCKK